jgi:alpha-N-arabinofuranosidase
MEIAGRYMDGLTLHSYTLPNDSWQDKGSATQFTAAEYYRTLQKTLRMETLISRHLNIMDRWDPEHRVGLIVDEWGAWYNVEPGTNPGFLFQQSTMRDALIAALNLNLFNHHADRVTMANIAQTVNVLQAVILTDGDRMVKTPTYHVFDLYKAHQDAALLETYLRTDDAGEGDFSVPQLSASASVGKDGVMTITLANTSVTDAAALPITLVGFSAKEVSVRVLTGRMDALNDFDTPDTVTVRDGSPVRPAGEGFTVTLPPCSVTAIAVK